jgi:hypothetical protein
MTQVEAFKKLADVRDGYETARQALSIALRAVQSPSPVQLGNAPQGITRHNIRQCAANLEITYLVRLFAEFEAILRDYFVSGWKRRTRPQMERLMDSIGTHCNVIANDLRDAHEVRNYRNDVIHNHLRHPNLNFAECRSRLGRFVRWLPRRW